VTFGWLAWIAALLVSRPASRSAVGGILALLLVGLWASQDSLHRYVKWQVPQYRAERACLAEVLAASDPRAAATAHSQYLLDLYPDVDHLLGVATALTQYQPLP
jgi:hypothetical protein